MALNWLDAGEVPLLESPWAGIALPWQDRRGTTTHLLRVALAQTLTLKYLTG